MIFVSAQPDELLFAWQTEVQLKNYQNLGIDLKSVYVLVGYQEGEENIARLRWNRIESNYPQVNVFYCLDSRESKQYAPSIRPFLLGKFFEAIPELQDEYMYYYDSDTVLKEIPAFEAIEDYRWHVSKADYISWNYINEKQSPTLMKDMLNSAGIDEETVEAKGQEVGGVQYFIYGTTPEFWKKVEQDCERMWKTHHAHFEIYRKEFSESTGRPISEWDFQIWCTDMWCIYWNALMLGVDVYVNPELNFTWPKHTEESLEEDKIYHDTGISEKESDKWFHKGSFRTKTPFTEDISKLGFFEDGTRSAQRYYLDIIQSISDSTKINKSYTVAELPAVSCLMTTYGRFECVERSIALWLLQDYVNKELVILNTAETPLVLAEELQNKGIRIYNNSKILGTDNEYSNVGQIRADIIKLALGKYYICWDDDDLYMPFHISKGIEYLLATGKKAYMPEKSYFSPDGGKTLEYASNSMEAACIVELKEIQKYGFIDSNGGEHLSWRTGLVKEGELDEHINVHPFESYMYLWGEEIASHKQSGSIENPNNFENHKAQSTDFGVRPLSLYSPLRIKLWFQKIVKFANSPELNQVMQKYL